MTTQSTSSNHRNAISGVIISKVNRKHLEKVMKENKIAFDASDDNAQLTVAAYAHFDKHTVADDLVQCDDCSGVSPADLDACPYCGKTEDADAATPEPSAPEAKTEAPIKKIEAKSTKEAKSMTTAMATTAKKSKANGASKEVEAMVVADSKELDKAIGDIKTLQNEGAVAMWRLGRRILDVYKAQLWKQRVENKKQAFRTFEQFCNTEINMTPNNAYGLMDVAEHFDEKQVREFGTSKLALVLQAPEKAQPKLLEAIVEGATLREVKEEVSAIKKKTGHRRVTRAGAKPNRNTEAASKARSEKATKAKKEVTIAKLLGRETVKLFCKPTTKKYEDKDLKPAKKLADHPWGILKLVNGVQQEFYVQQGADGSIKLVVVTEREED